MKLDKKQEILLAIYMEYQKDIPDMNRNIRHDKLGIDNQTFIVAIEKLQNEGFIVEAHFIRGGNSPIPIMVYTDNIKMTRAGLEYIEEKLSINRTLTGEEKLGELIKKAASWGWEQVKDIAAKTLAEMSKQ